MPLEKPSENEEKTVDGTSDAEDRSESETPQDKKYVLGPLCNYCTYCKVRVEQFGSFDSACSAFCLVSLNVRVF